MSILGVASRLGERGHDVGLLGNPIRQALDQGKVPLCRINPQDHGRTYHGTPGPLPSKKTA
jgi:hypothetical protein